MGEPRGPLRSERLVGRDGQCRMLLDAVRGAAEGSSCAVVVRGEAGIGKTALVRHAADLAVSEGFTLLWGAGLRFGSVQATCLPFVMALEGWLRAADRTAREDLLAAVDGAAALLPSLGGSPADAPSPTFMLCVDAVLGHLARTGPVLLVVDDVQWADPLSRDCLTYLVAGGGRRLAVVATCRDEDVGLDTTGLGTWLADVRRLPGVLELTLERLGPADTEDQLSGLLGRPPHPRVAAQVHERSAGVPYLTRLLGEGLDAGTETLPDDLPEVLTQAVQASWRRLDEDARRVLQILAASGAPAAAEQLVAACEIARLPRRTAERAVADGTAARIVAESDGRLWFRHPLLPQTLEAAMLPADRVATHATWADLAAATSSSGVDELRRLGSWALHLELARREADAVAVSLRAADLARDLSAPRVEALHLLRVAGALETDERVLPATVDPVALLERAARAATHTGDYATEAALATRALARVDPAQDPRTHARLLIRSAGSQFHLGRITEPPVDAYRRAVELTAPFPDSRGHADALATLAGALARSGRPDDARPLADRAVEAARRCGSPAALVNAHGVRSFVVSHDPAASDRDSALAVHYARQCDDPQQFSDAVIDRGNYLVAVGRLDEAADLNREAWRRAEALGSEGLAGKEAESVACRLLEVGLLREAAEVVRVALAPATAPSLSALARMTAMRLAVRCGDLAAADQHLARARELIPALETIPGFVAPPALAEHLLAHHDPSAALDLLERTLEVQVIDPRVADTMTMWASRAAADLAESARDRREEDAARATLARLDRFLEHRTRLGRGPNDMMTSGPDLSAMAAVTAAERARCAGQPSPDLWEEAATACHEARLVWDEWLTQLRLAETLLVTDRHHTRAAEVLRAVHRPAAEQGAAPLLERTTTLARLAGISLAEPAAGSVADHGPFAGLTPRERQVLDHLVAGRTYHEIAEALVISEKTVSVHVSNLLHKTGTASRRELAALAVRLRGPGTITADPGLPDPTTSRPPGTPAP